MKIMIIDDSKIDLFLHERLIKLSGISEDIVSCNNAESALHYIHEKLQTPVELPKVILLDIQMPEMDGFEFLYQLQQLPEEVCTSFIVIMISSTADLKDIGRVEANPLVFKLMKKPLETDHLKEIIITAQLQFKSISI